MSSHRATAAGVATATLAAIAAALAWREGSPLIPRGGGALSGGAPSDAKAAGFLAVVVAAYAAYVAGIWMLRRGGRLALVLAVAAAIQLAPLGSPLLLSTDAWTYWAYGSTAASGESPYRIPPADDPENPALEWMGADWRDTTSVYGPLFTLAWEPLARVAGDDPDVAAWLAKTLAAIGVLVSTVLAAVLTRRRSLAAAIVGWNPLLAIHGAGGGHNDAWLGALVLAALVFERRRRVGMAGFVWAAAILVKWIPLPLVALRLVAPGPERRRLGTTLAVSLAGLGLLSTWRYGTSWLGAFGPLADNAARATSYALPSRLEQLGLGSGIALVGAGAVLAGSAVVLVRQARGGVVRLGSAALVLLVTTPYLVVWYLLWAVPLAAADDDDTFARVGCVALGAYLLPQTIPL